ncbi:MAG TPA: aspartate aminotransferase family protein [Roseimicrobium sp.]|nr:aspartate aminotransferase family protein [Roseimicrobium sp.]
MASKRTQGQPFGTRTRAVLKELHTYESQNVTFIDPDGRWPMVWTEARGTRVTDIEGRHYLDLTGAFGVAAAGHANPRVVKAGQKQMATLLHAMGDVHPHPLKAALARELSKITFERWTRGKKSAMRGKTIFCNSGFEAVEAALKTALLATKRSGIIAFEGGYHGLGYGSLNATHRAHFRSPFLKQLGGFATFVPFPIEETARRTHPNKLLLKLKDVEKLLRAAFRKNRIGAVLLEPIQARGGINIPPAAFLPLLRRLCNEHGALLIFDEIYTGFGRTGRWFACEHSGTVPDLICLGKAMTGGFPMSACVGRAELMDKAWPVSNGEAIHTSTFLGHPVGCAMSLAQIGEIRRLKLPDRSQRLGQFLLKNLDAIRVPKGIKAQSRVIGLMAGWELWNEDGTPATTLALQLIKEMLHQGFILLPEGADANVISFTPPLTVSETELSRTIRTLEKTLHRLAS